MTRVAPPASADAIASSVPVAAADLERDGRTAATTRSTSSSDGDAGERTVEVDEVEADGALGVEAPRELDGVAAFDRHGLAPSLGEPHDASVEHVDRGDHFEFAC